jgi:hypothetical protein
MRCPLLLALYTINMPSPAHCAPRAARAAPLQPCRVRAHPHAAPCSPPSASAPNPRRTASCARAGSSAAAASRALSAARRALTAACRPRRSRRRRRWAPWMLLCLSIGERTASRHPARTRGAPPAATAAGPRPDVCPARTPTSASHMQRNTSPCLHYIRTRARGRQHGGGWLTAHTAAPHARRAGVALSAGEAMKAMSASSWMFGQSVRAQRVRPPMHPIP